MFRLGLLIGGYAYLIFFLGIFKFYYSNLILLVSFGYLIFSLTILLANKFKLNSKNFINSKTNIFLLFLIIFQFIIYSLGALGPEIGFDALWYHLTIPKLFLVNHGIFHIPGNLLYYSDMPKLVDLLYIPALMFGNEIIAKLIHFSFGILSTIFLYKLARKFLSEKFSLFAVIIFISNLVFAWEMTTAYVDLGWLFFEIMSLTAFLNWQKSKNYKDLLFLGIFIGLTLSVKLSAFSSVFIYLMLICLEGYFTKLNIKTNLKNLTIFLCTSLFIVSPWLIFAYINTGNPFFPLFSSQILISFKSELINLFKLFFYSPDPINPIYMLVLPFILIQFKKYDYKIKLLTYFVLFSVITWYFLGQIGGARYFLPYLGAFSILSAISIKLIKNNIYRNILICLIILISFISIAYRFFANTKYFPYVLGKETKEQFLTKNLNFAFGDFYDTDNYFKNNLIANDKVLMIGFHNLYYANFNFIDYSWLKETDTFSYIAILNAEFPKQFSKWKLVHYNRATNVKIYRKI